MSDPVPVPAGPDLAELRRLAEAAKADPRRWRRTFAAEVGPNTLLALLDRIEALEAAAPLLRKLAEGRREYAGTGPDWAQAALRHEAGVMDHVADALDGKVPWSELVGSYAPSWRWAEYGEHDPLPITHTTDDCAALERRLADRRRAAGPAGDPEPTDG